MNRRKTIILIIIIVAVVLQFGTTAYIFTNLKINNPYKIKIHSYTSEIEGLLAENICMQPAVENNNPYLEIQWKNTTDKSINHRCKFSFYKKVDNKWVDVKNDDTNYIQLNNVIEPNNIANLRYDLWNVNVNEVGTYKFETNFWQQLGMEFPTYKYEIELEVRKIPFSKSNLEPVTPYFDPAYTYGKPVLKGYATTLSQNVSEDGKHLDEGSVLNVTWYNGTGRDLNAYAENFRLFKRGADRFSEHPPAETQTKITIPTDGIQTISYDLNGVPVFEKGTYVLVAYFYTDTGYTYSEFVTFTIE